MWWDEALNTNKMSEKDTNKQLSRREHGDRRVNWEVGEHRCNVEFVLSFHIALTTENQFNLFAFFTVSAVMSVESQHSEWGLGEWSLTPGMFVLKNPNISSKNENETIKC